MAVSIFRFAELCLLLDPGKPPKNDKVEILSDATRLLSQLRDEEKNLKEANESLKDSIKNLKVSDLSRLLPCMVYTVFCPYSGHLSL